MKGLLGLALFVFSIVLCYLWSPAVKKQLNLECPITETENSRGSWFAITNRVMSKLCFEETGLLPE